MARLRTVFNGDERAADQAAQRLARAAIERNPLGFVKLGLHNYLGYWGGLRHLRASLEWEDGWHTLVNGFDASVVRSAFGADVSNQQTLRTPSRRYHMFARDWSVFLLASPLLACLALWLGPANPGGTGLLLGWTCLLLTATCLGANESAFRYLHPFSWTGLAAAAVLCEVLVSRRTRDPLRPAVEMCPQSFWHSSDTVLTQRFLPCSQCRKGIGVKAWSTLKLFRQEEAYVILQAEIVILCPYGSSLPR